MLSARLVADAANDWLDALPDAIGAALMARADALRSALQSKVVDDKLSGAVLETRSGALRRSIVSSLSSDGAAVSAIIEANGDAPYAAIQEFGGKTAAHDIVAKGRALAFVAGGGPVFARRVRHPGSVIPERSYLRAALEEMKDELVQDMTQAVLDALDAR